MCGFFAIKKINLTERDKNLVKTSIDFRGPDYQSEFIQYAGWTVYHARLSIIGINIAANQPLVTDDYLILFNGEILNYKNLGWRYFKKHYSSDTLLLGDLIRHNCLRLEEIDGFFAIAVIDRVGRVKTLARDRFGVKPLFFSSEQEISCISSEPAAIQRILRLPVNPQSIEEYRVARAPIFQGSYFNGINSVNPGECKIKGQFFNLEAHFDSTYEPVGEEELTASLTAGIQSRLVSDAPTALLLSRGIDSNLLRHLSPIEKFYGTGFEGDEDLEYLRLRQDIDINLKACTVESYRETFYNLINLRGEPLSVPNEVLLYLIAKRAKKEGVKVLLSGEGADEFFAGYDRVFCWAANHPFDLDVFLSLYCYQAPEKNSILYENFHFIFNRIRELSCFERVRYFFIKYHLPILFRRLDFSLMAAGVEGREPIANMHVFKKAIKMGPDQLIGNKLGKIPLRKLVENFETPEFAYYKKIGFPVDLSKIFGSMENNSNYQIWFEKNIEVLEF